jgi:hypothetical protein
MVDKIGPAKQAGGRSTRTVSRTDIGIDTYRSRLDLVKLDDFRRSNGGSGPDGQVTGGEPAFAGRHFLGGTGFLWGHGEATDCMTNPSPQNLSQLTRLTLLIAPVQAPSTSRQQVSGEVGRLYGAIDARALCDRLAAAVQAGEFTLPAAGRVAVWLSVDSTVALSTDYWAGWANQVNVFAFFAATTTGPQVLQPFRAAIQCRFVLTGGHLRPDPQVLTALTTARTAWRGLDTTSHACWADAPTTATPDWSVFAGGATPLIWRTSHGFHPTGGTANDTFDVDATNPGGTVPNALAFMLQVQQWQPGLPTVGGVGIIMDDHVTAARATTLKAATIPQLRDLSGKYTIPKARVSYVGRYFKPSITPKGTRVPTLAEVKLLSAALIDTFTISEDLTAIPSNQNIGYFDPALHHGTSDGTAAFTHCAEKLGQPSNTPIFFTIDNFDPAAVSTTAALTQAKNRITGYIDEIRAARDAYEALHPDYHYLIGLYANGEVLKWCYEKGTLDMFWQTASTGTTGSAYPNRPWYHANRWQYSIDPNLTAAGWTAWKGADPDADWGDGGRWNLRNPLISELTWVRFGQFLHRFTNLTVPAPR